MTRGRQVGPGVRTRIPEPRTRLPIWKLGYDYIVDLDWTILRPYQNWANHLDSLAEE